METLHGVYKPKIKIKSCTHAAGLGAQELVSYQVIIKYRTEVNKLHVNDCGMGKYCMLLRYTLHTEMCVALFKYTSLRKMRKMWG